MSSPAAFSRPQLASYSLLALPLAFAALPLYVLLPNLYARDFGMPLATLGAVLLAARAFDAFTDPLLGRLADRLGSGPARWSLAAGALSALALALGMAALWFPLPRTPVALAAWAFVGLVLTSAAWSQLGISHQAWGARLGQNELQRGRIMAWRESAGLAGVVLASLLPLLAGLAVTLVAIPATLVLFFVQDVLHAPAAQEPWFLATYFLCAALSMPLWLRAVARLGLARSWLAGMLLAVAAFAWTALLGAGDTAAFLVVCALSGAALGADLALPSALLAGVAAAQGEGQQQQGAYFGWWNLAAKLNLALAAGLPLPLLGALGYAPGARDPGALHTLTFAYALLPCALKLAAAAALYALVLRPHSAVPTPPQRKFT